MGTSTGSGVTHARADRRERGLALLIVLWIIVAAALIVSAFSATVRSGVSFVGSEVQLTKTQALLDAGAEIAAARLIDEEKDRAWVPDGSRHRISFAGSQLSIGIRDASGRIDLNKADKKLLMGLLRQFASSEVKAARLRDLILQARGRASANKTAKAMQANGSSGDVEVGANAPTEIPAFIDVAQLRGVPGVTPELYRAIAPFLTVYSGDGRVDAAAAPDEVLMSIPGMTQGDIEKLRAAAKAPDEDHDVRGDIAQSAGAYLAEEPGPAYLVTVDVLRPGAERAASAVYVVAPGLDGAAPYRLIAKRPVGSVPLSGAS